MAEIKHYDVVINGGGVSGLTLALALSQLSLRVAIIEPRNLVSVADDTIDLRVRALNHSSVTIFKNLNVWSSLTSERLAYFKQDKNVFIYYFLQLILIHVPVIAVISCKENIYVSI